MALPPDARRIGSIVGFVPWRKAVEKLLLSLDHRIAGINRSRTGEILVWPLATPPEGLLLANGQLVTVADHPDLHARLGTTYNTGGETPGVSFRVPNMGASPGPAPSVWVIRG